MTTILKLISKNFNLDESITISSDYHMNLKFTKTHNSKKFN